MSAAADLQPELDRRFRVTPEDRERMRRGEVPEKLRRGGANVGCLAFGAAGFGAAAGAIFGWNTHHVMGFRSPFAMYVAAFAFLGGLAAFMLFRRRFGGVIDAVGKRLREGPVHAEVLGVRLVQRAQAGRPLAVLLVEDGRELQAPPELLGLEVDGRHRVFFVDFTDLRASAGKAFPFALPLVAIAMEKP